MFWRLYALRAVGALADTRCCLTKPAITTRSASQLFHITNRSNFHSSSAVYTNAIASITAPVHTTRNHLIAAPGALVKSQRRFNQIQADEDSDEDTASERQAFRLRRLEKLIREYEARQLRNDACSRLIVETFDYLTAQAAILKESGSLNPETKKNFSIMAGSLLRGCGRVSVEWAPKFREAVAASIWEFFKHYELPVDLLHYNSLIKVLNENETQFDPTKILGEIQDAGLQPDRITYSGLILQYCVQGQVDKATEILEKMKEMKMPLSESLLSPLIIGYSKQPEPPTMKEMFDLIASSGIEPAAKSYVAAISVLAPKAATNEKAAAELDTIYTNLVTAETTISNLDVLYLLERLKPFKDSHEVCSKIFATLLESADYRSGRAKTIALLLRIGEYDFASEKVASFYPEGELRTHAGAFYARLLANSETVPVEFIAKEAEKWLQSNPNFVELLYRYASLEGNLKVVRVALEKMAESSKPECEYIWPLLAQAKSDEELVNVIKNDLKLVTCDTLKLIETLRRWFWPRFFARPERAFELRGELKISAKPLIASYLLGALVKRELESAVKFVSEIPQELFSGQDEDDESNRPLISMDYDETKESSFYEGRLIENLLSQLGRLNTDANLTQRIFDLYLSIYKPRDSRTFGSLVLPHLDENPTKALENFLQVAEKHRALPCLLTFMRKFLETNDADSLQKVMDASYMVQGETKTLFCLARACIFLERYKQVQKIFSNPNFVVAPEMFYSEARQLARLGLTENLLKFIELSRNFKSVDVERLYRTLIDKYESDGQADKILALWNHMQETDFLASKYLMNRIGRILEDNNIEAPFMTSARLR